VPTIYCFTLFIVFHCVQQRKLRDDPTDAAVCNKSLPGMRHLAKHKHRLLLVTIPTTAETGNLINNK